MTSSQAIGVKLYLSKDVEKMFCYDVVHRQGAQLVAKKMKVSPT